MKNLLNKFGFSFISSNPHEIKSCLKLIKEIINDTASQKHQGHIAENTKLNFFRKLYKSNIKPPYLARSVQIKN